MSIEISTDLPAPARTDIPELLECLRKIGKALIASGSPVGVVENTLTEIALAHHVSCEIVALPNILMIKIGQSMHELTDFTVQRPISLQLNQLSALGELIISPDKFIPVTAQADQLEVKSI